METWWKHFYTTFWYCPALDSVVQLRQSDAATAARRTTASRLFEVKIAACSNHRAAQDARRADPALQRQPCARPKLTASLDAVTVLGSCSLHTSGSEQLPTNTSNIYVVCVDLSCPDLHKCERYNTRKPHGHPCRPLQRAKCNTKTNSRANQASSLSACQ